MAAQQQQRAKRAAVCRKTGSLHSVPSQQAAEGLVKLKRKRAALETVPAAEHLSASCKGESDSDQSCFHCFDQNDVGATASLDQQRSNIDRQATNSQASGSGEGSTADSSHIPTGKRVHAQAKQDSLRKQQDPTSTQGATGSSNIIGKTVDIPAHVFGVEVPEMYYRGVVKKKDASHKGAVTVKFDDDGSLYWLPVGEVQKWIQDMERTGRTRDSQTTGQATDQFAANVLVDIYSQKHTICQ